MSNYLKNRKDLPNQPDPTADHSSQEDKTGRESVETADKSTQEKNVESEDCSEEEIETVKELGDKYPNPYNQAACAD